MPAYSVDFDCYMLAFLFFITRSQSVWHSDAMWPVAPQRWQTTPEGMGFPNFFVNRSRVPKIAPPQSHVKTREGEDELEENKLLLAAVPAGLGPKLRLLRDELDPAVQRASAIAHVLLHGRKVLAPDLRCSRTTADTIKALQ